MPPALGAAIRHEWGIDWDFLTVNHGSIRRDAETGARGAGQAWRRRLEAQPSRFMRAVLPDALRAAAARLAEFVGADGKDIAFVGERDDRLQRRAALAAACARR